MAPYIYIIAELVSVLFMILAQNSKARSGKESKTNKWTIKKYTIFFFFSFLPFAILFWLRHLDVGSDFYNYANMYVKIANGTLTARETEWLSVGFRVICQFMSFIIGENYLLMFAIINSITLFLLYKAIFQNSKIPWLSLFILFCFCLHFQIFNQFRQMLAIAITFYNIKNLKDKNLKKYFIVGIIAGAIHTTALIMLPFYFIANFKVDKKKIVLYLIVGVACYFGFGIIEKILSSTYYGRVYFGSKYDIEATSAVLNLFVRLILVAVSLYFYKPMMENNEDNKILYNMIIFCTIFQVLAVKSYIFARLTTYFYIYYVLLIPEIVHTVFKKQHNKKIAIFLILIVLSLYQYVYYNSSSGASGGGYLKYKFFWQE